MVPSNNNDEFEINFTTIFDIERKEKYEDRLQDLPPDFYEKLAKYLKDKIEFIESRQEHAEFDEINKLRIQLENIKKLIRKIYDRRETKIASLAINKVRISSGIVDFSSMLPEEKELFLDLEKVFKKYREAILERILKGELPGKELLEEKKEEEVKTMEEMKEVLDIVPVKNDLMEKENDLVMVRFLQPTPKFVGSDMEVYGPFEKDEIAYLKKEIAELLIQNEIAEEIKDLDVSDLEIQDKLEEVKEEQQNNELNEF